MNQKKVLVVGGGRVGLTIARDLATRFQVCVNDIDKANLKKISEKYELRTNSVNLLEDKNAGEFLSEFDLVVNASPGIIGFRILKVLLEEGKDVVDISFFIEDARELNEVAKSNDCLAVFDCGVAPGLCNIMLGRHLNDEIESYVCYVGGLPFNPKEPFNYKAPFSPSDVIEEYTRPARLRENGQDVIKEALTEIEDISVPDVGVLEAFNTDGLRSILYNTAIPNLKEKTIRYPGHANLMKVFRDSGFFNSDGMFISEKEISPLEFTSELLFKEWKLQETDDEFTYMKVRIESKKEAFEYEIFDRKDFKNNMSSMARTTGFTCAATCTFILDTGYQQSGVYAPEMLSGDEEYYNFVLDYLKKRGIQIHENRSVLD